MKLVRYGDIGVERPGLVDSDGKLRSLSPLIGDWTPELLSTESLNVLRALDTDKLPLVPGSPRLGVPVADLRQIFAVGLNFIDHSEETGLARTDHPMLFAKTIASLCGPDDDVAIPGDALKLDWEIEIAVVIGAKARRVSEAEALSYVAGLCLSIEFSERAWQMEMGGQHGKGKSYDRFTPLGPWLTTMDEIGDPQNLSMRLEVNGGVKQNGDTKDMIFDVATIVSHVSQYQTLMPGDIIQTGTPAGVAFGGANPVYLKPGDLVTCRADKLGAQRHAIKVEQG